MRPFLTFSAAALAIFPAAAGAQTYNWRNVEIVFRAVSSFVGRRVWERGWAQAECAVALPNP